MIYPRIMYLVTGSRMTGTKWFSNLQKALEYAAKLRSSGQRTAIEEKEIR